MHTPTKLASYLSVLKGYEISPIEVNCLLCSLGFQIRDANGFWKPTSRGQSLSTGYGSYNSEGKTYQGLFWDTDIISYLYKEHWVCPDEPVSKAVWQASIKPYPSRRAIYAQKFSTIKQYSNAA